MEDDKELELYRDEDNADVKEALYLSFLYKQSTDVFLVYRNRITGCNCWHKDECREKMSLGMLYKYTELSI